MNPSNFCAVDFFEPLCIDAAAADLMEAAGWDLSEALADGKCSDGALADA